VEQPEKKSARKINFKPFGIGTVALLILIGGIFGVKYIIENWPAPNTPAPTERTPVVVPTSTFTPSSISTPKPPTATPTPTLGIGSTQVSEQDGMVMVYVPAGEFVMGSDSGYSDEQPVHTVYLDAFWIDQTEVTNKMYALCVADGECAPPDSSESFTRRNYYGNPEYDDYPVIYVSWNDASEYCKWAGAELPAEAAWEKAARGTDGRTYPWGEGIDCQKANYYSCVGDTSRVGSYKSGKSPYGVYDMAGNVWEWVADRYSATYYAISPSSNPTGPTSGYYRVLRGGSWGPLDRIVRSALRREYDPTIAYSHIGFRCLRSP